MAATTECPNTCMIFNQQSYHTQEHDQWDRPVKLRMYHYQANYPNASLVKARNWLGHSQDIKRGSYDILDSQIVPHFAAQNP
jgi:hypothetical protein